MTRAADTPPADLVDELRRGLLAATARHIVNALQPDLAVQLVDAGLWPLSRALRHARSYADPYARATLLTHLLPHAPAEHRPALTAEVLQAARSLHELSAATLYVALGNRLAPAGPASPGPAFPGLVAAHCAGLVPADHAAAHCAGLVPADVATVIAEARRLRDDRHRCRALSGLAGHLSPAERAETLYLTKTQDGPGHVEALSGLSPHLSPDELAEAWRWAETLAEPVYRVMALAVLAPHVPEPDRTDIVRAAFDAAAAVPGGVPGAGPLGALAPLLPDDLVEPALTAVLGARLPHLIRQLRRLAPRLSPEHLSRAADAVDEIEIEEFRGLGYVALAPHLPPDRVERMVAVAAGFADPEATAETMTGLAPHLPPTERRAALTRATVEAAVIGDHDSRARVLAALVPHLSDPGRRRALEAVSALVPAVCDGTLPLLIPFLDPPARRAALARALADIRPQGGELAALAPLLDDDQRAEILGHAEAITFPPDRVAAVVALLPQLPPATRTAALDRIMTAIDAETNAISRVRHLADLVPHLPPGRAAEALATAVALLPTIDRPYSRADALAAVHPYLPPHEAARLVGEVRADAERIGPQEVTLSMQYFQPPAEDSPPLTRVRAALDLGRRSLVLAAVAALVPVIIDLAGPGAADRLLEVLDEVTERWP